MDSAENLVNPNIEIAPYQHEFTENGCVRIREFLTKEAADSVLEAMTKDIEWKFATTVDGKDTLFSAAEWRALGHQQQQAILQKSAIAARNGFHYAIEYYQLLSAYMEQWEPKTYLHTLAAFIRSEFFLNFTRQVTGLEEIAEADCQATRYQAGHYLTMHTDGHIDRRLVAYVMGFTPVWRPDWGGLLQFFDQNGDITSGFKPTFNTLTMFAVPRDHSVSFVAPCAGGPRLTVTGWLLRKP